MQLAAALPLPLSALAGLGAAVLIYFLVLLANEAVSIPLSQEAVDSMLKMADLRPDDVLFDLGGDGRIVIATKKYGIRAVGIEKSKILTWLSKRAIRKNKLEDKVRILNANLFEQDLSEATVVTTYLSQKNERYA